jgi:hypothetical protein
MELKIGAATDLENIFQRPGPLISGEYFQIEVFNGDSSPQAFNNSTSQGAGK